MNFTICNYCGTALFKENRGTRIPRHNHRANLKLTCRGSGKETVVLKTNKSKIPGIFTSHINIK